MINVVTPPIFTLSKIPTNIFIPLEHLSKIKLDRDSRYYGLQTLLKTNPNNCKCKSQFNSDDKQSKKDNQHFTIAIANLIYKYKQITAISCQVMRSTDIICKRNSSNIFCTKFNLIFLSGI